MKKRRYPLFIVDASHTHGRERECDYISCTSTSTPFVAAKDFITEEQYKEEYDPQNYKAVYSENVRGVRMRARILDIAEDADKGEAKSLMKRLLKELLTRQQVQRVELDNIKPENIVRVMERLREQVYEALRENPDDLTQKMMAAIFTKVINDYTE